MADALAGRSRVTVLRGEAGVGKTALLDYLSDQVCGWHIARAVGVESEMELAYAGLHQLCAPMLDNLGRLPAPQRDALATVFGRSAGAPPDRFLIGLATLTLFAEVAEQQPLVCIVDDAQWLDHASAQILGFVARRLLAEPIAVVCAARTGIGDDVLAGLPVLPVAPLGDSDARALLLANVPGPLDARVCDQIVAESHGNPLALLELPRTWNAADLAGGFGLPSSQPVAGRIEQSYIRRLRLLPPDTQLLVLTAAAEPLGDRVLLHRAAGMLGIDIAAAGPAQDGGLLELGGRVEFAHPLVRSAAYRSAAADDQRLHYMEAGEGPLIVLLHGFPEFWYGWRLQIQPLAAAGFRVVAPDTRGYNVSSKPDGVKAYDVGLLAADIRDLIHERGEQSALLAGHDWGGSIAWATAMNHPEVVERLAILNAAHPRKLSQGLHHPSQLRRSWYFFFFDLPDLPESVVHANNWHFFRHFLHDAHPAYTPEEMDRYIAAWSQPGAATGMINYYRSSVRTPPKQAEAALRAIKAPTLVIWGQRDRYLGEDLAEPEHDDVPNLDRVERLPDASHWVHHDEAERVNQLLTDFFAPAKN